MPDHASSADDLAALLERLRLEPAGARTPDQVAQAQLDLLLARIASLTTALRTARHGAHPDAHHGAHPDAHPEAESRAAARLLLADLTLVTSQFRGQTNALSASLGGALEGLRTAIEHAPEE